MSVTPRRKTLRHVIQLALLLPLAMVPSDVSDSEASVNLHLLVRTTWSRAPTDLRWTYSMNKKYILVILSHEDFKDVTI